MILPNINDNLRETFKFGCACSLVPSTSLGKTGLEFKLYNLQLLQ